MTYQEAKHIKDSKGNFIIENGIKYLILIVPKSVDDMIKFLSNYSEDTYSDKDCLDFSTDGQYIPYAYVSDESRHLLRS